jgi:hypothetical protein
MGISDTLNPMSLDADAWSTRAASDNSSLSEAPLPLEPFEFPIPASEAISDGRNTAHVVNINSALIHGHEFLDVIQSKNRGEHVQTGMICVANPQTVQFNASDSTDVFGAPTLVISASPIAGRRKVRQCVPTASVALESHFGSAARRTTLANANIFGEFCAGSPRGVSNPAWSSTEMSDTENPRSWATLSMFSRPGSGASESCMAKIRRIAWAWEALALSMPR